MLIFFTDRGVKEDQFDDFEYNYYSGLLLNADKFIDEFDLHLPRIKNKFTKNF